MPTAYRTFCRLTLLLAITLGMATMGCKNANEITIISQGKSDWQIVVNAQADSLEQQAATALQTYLEKISGFNMPVTNTAAASNNIFIGSASKPYGAAQEQDYTIISEANALHIAGANPLKTLEAVYLFLEKYAGVQYLAPDAEIVPAQQTLTLTAADKLSPAVQVRTVHSKLFYDNPEFAHKRRVTTEGFPHFVPEARVHSFHRLVPAAQWLKSNPEFFAWTNGRRQPTQLCLSNDTVYQLVRDSVKVWFDRNPRAYVLSVSQDDNTQYCTCERCAAVDKAEGSPSGTMIHFVNRIARDFPDKTIATLAYQYTRKAPLKVKPEKNVMITLCSIECDRSGPIAQKCKDFEDDLLGWGKAGARLQIWDYTTQFTNFLSPFPNLHTLQPNIQLFVANNARWIFEQHSHNRSEMFELRSWLTSQFLWNPNASYDSLMNIFFTGYYGKAGPLVKQYIDETQRVIQNDPKYFLYLYGDPSQAFGSYLDEAHLQQYHQWFDDAERQVAGDNALLKRVRLARVGVDFATLEYYRRNKGAFSLSDTAKLQPLLARFESTCQDGGILILNEMGLKVTEYLAAYQALAKLAGQPNLAAGKQVTLLTKPKKYAGEKPETLTDGTFGGWSFYANWLGFEGNDLEAVIDLGSVQSFKKISMNFLQVTNHLVFYPTAVSFYVSENGTDYSLADVVANKFPFEPTSKTNDIQAFVTKPLQGKARYIKVAASNMKTPPIWHHGTGLGAWIFADEVLVSN